MNCTTVYSDLQATARYWSEQKGVVSTAREELLSLQEAGDRLGVSVYTVRRWIQTGKLRAFKPGKEYRVREADLEEFLRAREVVPKGLAPTSPQRSLLNHLADVEEERRRPTDREIRALDRWLSYLQLRLDKHNLTAPEIMHELDAAIAFGRRVAEYPDEVFRRFMQLVGRAFEEAKSLKALQDELAGLEASMKHLEEAHEQVKERR
jgi:excisionase family DNA binding protein